MSISPLTALTKGRRSEQSPPRCLSQYHGQFPNAGLHDTNRRQISASNADGAPTLASKCYSYTKTYFDTVHPIDKRRELGPSILSQQGGYHALKTQVKVEPVHNGSASFSLTSELPAVSVEAEQDDQMDGEDDEDEAMLTAESEESAGAYQWPATAAERRAENRKMRRFRLTHNQTRFLLNEFARQAHPDAAQRGRLSREVPGLSPRQVQVWFQNRRAKLKRLTSDDRERMMKSRALPDDFDMTQAMKSPLGRLSQSTTAPSLSRLCYAPVSKGAVTLLPLTIDELMRQGDDNGVLSPISMVSARNNTYTPPSSISASASISPSTSVNELMQFDMHAIPQITNQRQPISFVRSGNFSALYHYPSHLSSTPVLDQSQRARAESLASPLRSSMSYSTNTVDYGDARTPTAAAPSSFAQYGQSGQVVTGDEQSRTSLGIERPCTAHPVPTLFPHVTDDQLCGLPAKVSAHSSPLGTAFPPALSLRPQPKAHPGRLHLQQALEPQDLQSAPLTAPEYFHLRQTSSQYPATFSPGLPLTSGRPEIYAWDEPRSQESIGKEQTSEPEGCSRDSDIHSLQRSIGNFQNISRGGSFSKPISSTGRPKSFTYGTIYY